MPSGQLVLHCEGTGTSPTLANCKAQLAYLLMRGLRRSVSSQLCDASEVQFRFDLQPPVRCWLMLRPLQTDATSLREQDITNTARCMCAGAHAPFRVHLRK